MSALTADVIHDLRSLPLCRRQPGIKPVNTTHHQHGWHVEAKMGILAPKLNKSKTFFQIRYQYIEKISDLKRPGIVPFRANLTYFMTKCVIHGQNKRIFSISVRQYILVLLLEWKYNDEILVLVF